MSENDYPTLLKAYALIGDTVGKTQLWIVGAGELLPILKNLVQVLSIDKRVKFLGIRPDIPDLMNAADIFALSSAWEGFGLVVCEAMACEKIVVATDCGGVKEIVGDYGFLVPPGSVVEFAAILGKALRLPSLEKQSIGYAARKRIENNFSLKKIANTWLKLYKNNQQV